MARPLIVAFAVAATNQSERLPRGDNIFLPIKRMFDSARVSAHTGGAVLLVNNGDAARPVVENTGP